MAEPFSTHCTAAQELLRSAWSGATNLTWKAASFAGQASVSTEPLTERQAHWLNQLLDRAGLPPFDGGGDVR